MTPLITPSIEPPLDLPRLLMRRAGGVALAALLLALCLGLARIGSDIEAEVDAAIALAQLVARLGPLAQADDAQALAVLRAVEAEHPPRHLLLSVLTGDGQQLLAPAAAPPDNWPLRALLALHQRVFPAPDARKVSWTLARPGGERWTLLLTASPESERREAVINLAGTLSLLLICIAGLLLAMRWNLRRALAPLDRLLAAITGIENHDLQRVQALPSMPVRELEAVAASLRHLAGALDAAQARRRLLSQQLLSLQEDERARLARELHDEFGQRLTALRVDAAWLSRRLAGQAESAPVIAGMAAQCQQIQHDIRSLLTRLQPFGPAEPAPPGGDAVDGAQPLMLAQTQPQTQSLARLVDLLHSLVAAWTATAGREGTAFHLEWLTELAGGQTGPEPDAASAEAWRLPQALALSLYRISQEALTNAARHAQARRVVLRLVCRMPLAPAGSGSLAWSVSDDGAGLPDGEAAHWRGNGLSGLRERVWAQGAELHLARPPGGGGLLLSARFELPGSVPPTSAQSAKSAPSVQVAQKAQSAQPAPSTPSAPSAQPAQLTHSAQTPPAARQPDSTHQASP